MEEFLKRTYFQNTVLDYATALIIFGVCVLAIYIIRKIAIDALTNWSHKTNTHLDKILVTGLQRLAMPFLYFVSFYLAFKSLTLSPKVIKVADTIYVIILIYIIIRLIISVLNYLLLNYFRKLERGIEFAYPTQTVFVNKDE